MPSLVEFGPSVFGGEAGFFQKLSMCFIMLLLSPFDKGYGPLFKQTWICLGMLYVKFGWNCLSNSEEKDTDR